tara:strand:- start:1064 stop:1477 length:414 start_codon:yes stop_codon:yes gene_type:complete
MSSGKKISFLYQKDGEGEDYVKIVIDPITKENLIKILIGDEVQENFKDFLENHGEIFKDFYQKYEYKNDDKRFYQQDHSVLLKNESIFSITMFGENTVNFVSLIGTSKLDEGVIKKNIIPKLKKLGYKDPRDSELLY